MKKTLNRSMFVSLISVLLLTSCQKSFLEKKPDQSLVVPTTLADLQGLLDNNGIMNASPVLPIISSDEYYVTNTYYQTAAAVPRNAYTWAANILDGGQSGDWNNSYKQIFYANVILDALKVRTNDLSTQERNIKGAALFFRAWGHFQLSEAFCKPYLAQSAKVDPGIPTSTRCPAAGRSKKPMPA
jgi:hypothetical protein